MNDPIKKFYKNVNDNDKLNIDLQKQYDVANLQVQNNLLKNIKNMKPIIDKKIINPEDEASIITQANYDKYIFLNDKLASTTRDELLNNIKDASLYPMSLNDDISSDYKILKKNMNNIMTNLGDIESIVNELSIEQIKKLNNNFINIQNKYIQKYGYNNPNLSNNEIKIFLLNEIAMSKLESTDFVTLKKEILENLSYVNDNVKFTNDNLIQLTDELNSLKNNDNIQLKDFTDLLNKIKHFEKKNIELQQENIELEKKIEIINLDNEDNEDNKKLLSMYKKDYNDISLKNERSINDFNNLKIEKDNLLNIIKKKDKTIFEKDKIINNLKKKIIQLFSKNTDLQNKNNNLLNDVMLIKNLNDNIKKDYENKLTYNRNELDNIKKLFTESFERSDTKESELNELVNAHNKLFDENKQLNIDMNLLIKKNEELTSKSINQDKINILNKYTLNNLKEFIEFNGANVNLLKKKENIKFILDNNLYDAFLVYIEKNKILPKKGEDKEGVISEKKGQGINNLVKLGDIYINKKKLFNDNIISICYANKCKIDLYNNKKISDLLVELLMNVIDNKIVNKNDYILLSDKEKLIYNSLLRLANLHKQNNINIEDTVEKLKHQLQLLEGEILAGNTNKNLIIELKEILRKMINFKLISLSNAKKYIKEINSVNK